jgi:muramidase (phage lysozyme)
MTPKEAFLGTIAYSEGTDHPRQKTRNKGYDVIVGGALFTDYSKHPGVMVSLPRLGIKSTAAGRYQILKKYADHYIEQLRLSDFGPASQDLIAWQLIGECGAKADVLAGRFESAIYKCRSRWASLPGAGYGQHEHSITNLRRVYDELLKK